MDPALKNVQMRRARYALFKVTSSSPSSPLTIVLDKEGARASTYRDFLRDLKDNAPRFAVYDYEYQSPDGRPTSSLYCLYWMPQQVNQQERIVYSSAKNNFVQHLTGYKHFTAEEKDEVKELLEAEVLIEKRAAAE